MTKTTTFLRMRYAVGQTTNTSRNETVLWVQIIGCPWRISHGFRLQFIMARKKTSEFQQTFLSYFLLQSFLRHFSGFSRLGMHFRKILGSLFLCHSLDSSLTSGNKGIHTLDRRIPRVTDKGVHKLLKHSNDWKLFLSRRTTTLEQSQPFFHETRVEAGEIKAQSF